MPPTRDEELKSGASITVDVIEDALFTGLALKRFAAVPGSPLRVQRREPGWISYIASFDAAADVVVVRDELDDHVPTVLKVRVLAQIGARPVVLADEVSPMREWRLVSEGATAVFDRNASVQELVAYLGAGAPLRCPRHPRQGREDRLSDRELQVACVFVGRAAPSTTVISGLLGIPVASVRTYLQRARLVLRAEGPTSSRSELAAVMRRQGWL